ncbi:MAG: hypothetical protein Q9170_000803 [Blastenia crenularia]
MLDFAAFVSLLLIATPIQARIGILEHDGHARPVELSMCDTQQPDDALRLIHSELSAQKKLRKVKPRAPQAFIIDTYSHFIVAADSVTLYPPQKRSQLAADQLKALNAAYAPMNITFNPPVPPTYTVNTTWATNTDGDAMKSALRMGPYSSLNLYFQSNLTTPGAVYSPSSFLLGYCELPTSTTQTTCSWSPNHNAANSSGCTTTSSPPSNYAADGCNILLSTMPGGAMQEYNEGGTAVHEVGHWFGLLHTFQDNTCSSTNPGDYVDDTPQEMTATDGCPVGKDSCPGSPGADPIGNYMDYSTDACYTGFSAGQQQRVIDMYKRLRLGK